MIKLDASNYTLGRLATTIARVLRGKDKANFSPNVISGEEVYIYNMNKIQLSGNKKSQKTYITHSGYIGHLKKVTLGQIGLEKTLHNAVWGMLPNNRLRKRLMKRLKINT